jgi:hypothetical protein
MPDSRQARLGRFVRTPLLPIEGHGMELACLEQFQPSSFRKAAASF